jgi:hypothetical protein
MPFIFGGILAFFTSISVFMIFKMSLPALKGGVSWQALQTPRGSFRKESIVFRVSYPANFFGKE